MENRKGGGGLKKGGIVCVYPDETSDSLPVVFS